MPFQPINYSNIEPQGNPFLRNIVESLTSGYKAGRLPYETNQLEQKQNLDNTHQHLANIMSNMLNIEQPDKFKADQAHTWSETGFNNANTNKINTMTPLEAIKMSLENRFYPKIAQSQIDTSQMATDPNKKIAYIKALADGFSKNGMMGGGDSNNIESSGSGVSNTRGSEGGNLRTMLVRQALGLPTQTPQEKLQQQLALYEAKQKFTKSADNPTTATVTSNQNVIQAVNNVLPLIDDLKKFHSPGQLVGKYLHPNDQAKYEAQVATITDSLVSALKLPKTNESIALAQKIVGKRAWENDKNYVERLKSLSKDLDVRRGRSRDALKGVGLSEDNQKDIGDTFNLESGEFE